MAHTRYLLVPVLFLGALTPGLSIADFTEAAAGRAGGTGCAAGGGIMPERPGFALLAPPAPPPCG